MRCGVIVQIGPRTEERVRPGCLSSGLQPLIRSRVPGRIGPTPRQLLPDVTLWRHNASVRLEWGNYFNRKSIDDTVRISFPAKINFVTVPQTVFGNAFSR